MRKLKERNNNKYILIALFGVVVLLLTSLFAVLINNTSRVARNELTASADAGVTVSVFGGTLSEADTAKFVDIAQDGTYTLSYPSETLPSDVKNEAYYTERARYYSVTFEPGTYEITLAGAQGGYAQINGKISAGQYGSRTSGTITFSERTTLYIHVGGAGGGSTSSSKVSYGGYNGGGDGGLLGVNGAVAAGGGGATDIRIANSKRVASSRSVMSVFNDDESLSSRIMVAAGGGGATAYTNGTAKSGESATALRGGTVEKSTAVSSNANGEFGFGGGTSSAVSTLANWSANGVDYSNQVYAIAGGGGGGYYGGAAGSCYYYNQNGRTNFSSYVASGNGSNYISTDGKYAFDGASSSDSVNGVSEASADGFAIIKRVAAASTEAGVQRVKATVIAENSAGAFSGSETDASYYSYSGATLTLQYPAAESRHVNADSRADRYWKVKFYAGVYTIDLFGAQGGMYTISDDETEYAVGGSGGKTTLTITVNKEMYLYFYIGGAGDSAQRLSATSERTRSHGGFNGGGTSPVTSAAGGGATDIRFVNAKDAYVNDSLSTRLAVAGGGGGAGRGAAGGAGGGLSGASGVLNANRTEGGSVIGSAGTQQTAGVNTSFSVMNGDLGIGGGIIKRDSNNALPDGSSYPLGYKEGGGGGGGFYGGARASGYDASGGGGSAFCYGIESSGDASSALVNAINNSGITVSDQATEEGVNGYDISHTINDGQPCARDGYAVITYAQDVSDTATANDVGVASLNLLGDGMANVSDTTGATSAETYSYYYKTDASSALKLNIPTKLVTRNEDVNKDNRYYAVTLKPGAYKFTLAGGQGGSMQKDASNRNGIGGAGAIISATLTLTEETTLYIHVGGAGNSYTQNYMGARLGGYNGGGDSIGTAAAGGGASDIRLKESRSSNNSAGNSLSTYNNIDSVSTRIMVAGGGGGANDFTSGGAGGGVNGKSLVGDNGIGGSFGSGGAGGDMLATNGGFGGGVTAASSLQDGGGGGGGYSGGGAGGSTTGAGGGGSSYVSGATFGTTTCSIQSNYVFADVEVDANGNKATGIEGMAGGAGGEGTPLSQNGYAIIERVNAAPVAVSNINHSGVRGEKIEVSAADLATDPDSPTSVTDPVTIDLANPKLYYLNSVGEYVIDDVGLVTIGKELVEGAEKTVFSINGYPNRTLPYVTTDGEVTLYVRVYDKGLDGKGNHVRDTYVPVTFTVNIDDYDAILAKTNTDFEVELSDNSLSLEFKNPLSVLSENAHTINTAKLLENADTFMASNELYFALGSNIAFDYNTVTQLKAVESSSSEKHSVVSINASGEVQYVNVLSAVHLYGSATGSSNTTYLSNVTVYQVDKITGYVISARTMSITYELKNTAPVLGATKHASLKVGKDTVVDLADFIYDAENNESGLAVSNVSHTITSISVPVNEVAVDNSTTNYYSTAELSTNIPTGFDSSFIDNTDSQNAFVEYAIAANEGSIALTGLRATYSRYVSNRNKENLGHFYIAIHIQDKFDGETYIVPFAVTVENTAPVAYNSKASYDAPEGTHQSILYTSSTLPTVSGSVGDEVYLTPFSVFSGIGSPVAIGGILNGGEFVDKKDSAVGVSFDYDFFKVNTEVINDYVNFTGTGDEVVNAMYDSLGMRSGNVNDTSVLSLEAVDWYYPVSAVTQRIVVSGANDNLGTYAMPTLEINGVDYFKTLAVKVTLKSSTADAYLIGSASVNDACGIKTGAESSVVQFAVTIDNTAPTIKKANSVYSEEGKLKIDADEHGNITKVNYDIHVKTGDTVLFTPYDFVYDLDMLSYGLRDNFNLNRFVGAFDNTGAFVLGAKADTSGQLNVDKSIRGSLNGDTALSDEEAYDALAADLSKITNGTLFSSARTSNEYTEDSFNSSGQISSSDVRVNKGLYFKRVNGGISNVLTNLESGTQNLSCLNIDSCTSASSIKTQDTANSLISNNCDVISISAARANVTPATVVFKIYDNTMSTGDGITVTVNIKVTNSVPRFADGALSSNPVLKVLAQTAAGETYYSSYSFLSSLLTDDDGDVVRFSSVNPPKICTKDDSNNLVETVNIGGTVYNMSEFLRAEYDATLTTLTVTALNSTIALPKGAWVQFTATDDKETVTLSFQIEVLNSIMSAHTTGDYSLSLTTDDTEKLTHNDATSIDTAIINDTTSGSSGAAKDMYYFVSNSSVAEKIINGNILYADNTKLSGVQSKVKVVADDSDRLQSSPILTAANPFVQNGYGDTTDYISNPSSLIPQVTQNFSSTTAVRVFTSSPTSNFKILLILKDTSTGNFIAYDSATDQDKYAKGNDFSSVFDDIGRFNVVDWAIQVKPNVNSTLEFAIVMRDNDLFGGDTYDNNTAYSFDRTQSKIKERGLYVLGVKLRVVNAGIVSYEHYIDNYGGNYVVEDGDTAYVATYDGNPESLYDQATAEALTYNSSTGVIGKGGDKELRTASTSYDGSNAGVKTGVTYSSGQTYEDAFVYSNTVNVSSSGSIYLPMSYLAVPNADQNTYSASGVNYNANGYSAYAYRNGGSAAPIRQEDFVTKEVVYQALTLSDGFGNTWTGTELSHNPYIIITAASAATAANSSDMRYVNRAFSAYTNPSESDSANRTATQNGLRDMAANANPSNGFGTNFSHENSGALMFLNGDIKDKDFIENRYGLIISKNQLRSVNSDLTLTVKMGKYTAGGTLVSDVNTELVDISVKLNVENAPILLSTTKTDGTASPTVQYDNANATYYSAISMNSSDSAITIEPTRDDGERNGSVVKIGYYDADILNDAVNGITSDGARFALESTLKYSMLSSSVKSHLQSGKTYFANALNSDNASSGSYGTNEQDRTQNITRTQNSLLRYFSINDFGNLGAITDDYQPNSGVYGTNNNANDGNTNVPDTVIEKTGNEGYSSYFSLSITSNGSLVISPKSRTIINTSVLQKICNNATPSTTQITAAYTSRGLVPVFAQNSNTVVSAYYPLKVLIYDGQSSADLGRTSYTAIEIRVTILNTPVSAASTNGTVTLSMAKGETSKLALSDVLSDTDFARTANNGIYTKEGLEKSTSGIMYENGDYAVLHNFAGNINDFTLNQFVNPVNNLNFYTATDQNGVPINNDFPVTLWHSSDTSGDASLNFRVNDRIITSDHVTHDNVTFRLTFTDSSEKETITVSIVINITNTSPTVTVNSNSSITMNSGAYFTALATSYANFTSKGTTDDDNAAYLNSLTYYNYINRNVMSSSENLTLTRAWKYSDTDGAEFDFNQSGSGDYSHGFLRLANDDAPYSLRVSYSPSLNAAIDNNIIVRAHNVYTSEYNSSGELLGTAIEIVARRPCRNMPLILTVSDGQGGSTNIRIRITIESSAPAPLDVVGGLSRYLTPSASNIPGEYDLYITPSSSVDEYTYTDINTTEHIVAGGSVSIPLNQIVNDPDGDDNNNLSLYSYWSSTDINDRTIKNSGKSYVTATASGGSVVFNCISYNRNQASSGIIEFYVNDPGGSAAGNNLCYIRINLFTMYNSLVNAEFGNEIRNAVDATWSSSVTRTITSKYAAEIEGADTSADQISVVGGAQSEITDLDESGRYSLSLYVLADATDDGITPMTIRSQSGYTQIRQYNFVNNYIIAPRDNIDQSEVQDIYNGYVYLDESNETFANAFGGYRLLTMTSDGTVNTTYKYETFANYFEVMPEITNDGEVILKFKAQSYMSNVNFYVQVTKQLVRTDNENAKLSNGFTFSISNSNSRPFAEQEVVEVRGTKGYTQTFPVFGTSGALFDDYDTGDIVSLSLPMTGSLVDYESIVARNDPSDWNNSDKGYAFTLRQNAADGTLTVRINRRVDEYDSISSTFKEEVTLHLSITGVDEFGATCTAAINLVICNSAPEAQLNSTYVQNDEDGNVLYTVASNEVGGIVDINAMVRQDASEDLFIRFADIVTDDDYDAALAANNAYVDSFRLGAAYSGGGRTSSLTSTSTLKIYYESGGRNYDFADITPVFSTSPEHMVNDNPFVYTGFTIRALTYDTSSTSTFYVRVIDRSTIAPAATTLGVLFRVTVSIANSAPTVIDDMDNKVISIIGAETEEELVTSETLKVSDFVTDPNPSNQATTMRVSTYTANRTTSVFTADGAASTSSTLVSMSYVSSSEDASAALDYRSFRFNPRVGLYGEQTFTVTVTDGYSSDEKTVTFNIIVRVLFNYEALPELSTISTYRAKKIDVTVAGLIPSFIASETDSGEAVATAANFTPADFYTITSVTANVEDSSYLTVSRRTDDSGWTISASAITPSSRTLTVIFAVKDYFIDDKQVTFTRTLKVDIAENTMPTLLEDMRHKIFSKTSNDMYALSDGGEVVLSYDLLVSDAENDEIVLVSARSSVSSIVGVSIANNFLTIKFNASGTSVITLVVSDETGDETSLAFRVTNMDLDSPSLWLSIAASFQTSPVGWYVGIFGVILVIIVIAIIISIHNRRVQRRLEDQAQLAAELEIEKEVYGLNGSVMQSYGYLPPSEEDQLEALAAAAEQGGLLDAPLDEGEEALGLDAPSPDDDEPII